MRRVLVAVVLMGAAALLTGCARDEARAAGAAERWLAAVNDQGRDNLRDDSIERAIEYGEQSLVERVVPANAEDDERHFTDYEVGKALETGDTARVPFRLTARIEGDTEEREGTFVMTHTAEGWRVTGVEPRGAGERVPSEGGARPASASLAHWLGAAVLGVAVTVASALVIRRQPESTAGARRE